MTDRITGVILEEERDISTTPKKIAYSKSVRTSSGKKRIVSTHFDTLKRNVPQICCGPGTPIVKSRHCVIRASYEFFCRVYYNLDR